MASGQRRPHDPAALAVASSLRESGAWEDDPRGPTSLGSLGDKVSDKCDTTSATSAPHATTHSTILGSPHESQILLGRPFSEEIVDPTLNTLDQGAVLGHGRLLASPEPLPQHEARGSLPNASPSTTASCGYLPASNADVDTSGAGGTDKTALPATTCDLQSDTNGWDAPKESPDSLALANHTSDPTASYLDSKESQTAVLSSTTNSAKPRLSIGTTLTVPLSEMTEPGSPGLRRWAAIRDQVVADSSEKGRPDVDKDRGPRDKGMGMMSKAAGRLGFKLASDNTGSESKRSSTPNRLSRIGSFTEAEYEQVSKERYRFTQDIKTCLAECAAEETRRRQQRQSQLAGNAVSPPPGALFAKGWLQHHHNNYHSYQSEAKSSATPSVHSGLAGAPTPPPNVINTFSSYAPLLSVLHNYLPAARAKKIWARTLPNHEPILAELGIIFSPAAGGSDSDLHGERMQVLEVFGTIVRNWASDSATEEMQRWTWLCRVMLADDKVIRTRGLDLLNRMLHRDTSLPRALDRPHRAADVVSLADSLFSLLFALENSKPESLDQQEIVKKLIVELSNRMIVHVDWQSVVELVKDVHLEDLTEENEDAVTPELIWLAVSNMVGRDTRLASWVLGGEESVFKRWAPSPIMKSSPTIIVSLRIRSTGNVLAAISALIRSTDDSLLVTHASATADYMFASSERQQLPDADGVILSGYLTVLLDLEMRRYTTKVPIKNDEPWKRATPQRMPTFNEHRVILERLLNDNRTGPLQRSATNIVTFYPIIRLLAAVRAFFESGLESLGGSCVPPLLQRLTTCNYHPDIRPFVSWLLKKYPQVFYKHLFACAASTQATKLATPLSIAIALCDIIGPEEYWMEADPQMITIALIGNVRLLPAKGKSKEGDAPSVRNVKLGRYAVLVELLHALETAGHPSSPKRKAFLTLLESQFGALLESEEKEGPLPQRYRSLVCQLFDKLRSSSMWIKRSAATRIAVTWYISDGNQRGNSPPPSKEGLQVDALKKLYSALERTGVIRVKYLKVDVINSLATFLVTVQASLSTEDWGQLLPALWERYGERQNPTEQMTFLLMKCGQTVPAGLRNTVLAQLSNAAETSLHTRALLKLAMLYGYRFQVMTQPTIRDGDRVFRFPGRQLDLVMTEVGSRDWVTPRDAQEKALHKFGRALPLELRRRLKSLGWNDDDPFESTDWELVPVSMLPAADGIESTAGDQQRSSSPAPGQTKLKRSASSSSGSSTVSKVRRPILPPIVLQLVNEQARLLSDSRDMTVKALSNELVRLLERDDAMLFARPVTDVLKSDLPMALTRLNAVIAHPTPQFAYVAINTVFGWLKTLSKTSISPGHWAVLLGTASRLVPYVSELSLRDMRKNKVESLLLPGSIYDDEFKLYEPWLHGQVDVQTAQIIVLADMLSVNRRDVYLIKKLLFKLHGKTLFTHLPFARAWLQLIISIFSSLNSNYNDGDELRCFVNMISTVLDTHGQKDILVAGLAMRALTLCAARFRRAFVSIGFVEIMRTIYRVYSQAHSGIKDCIVYACHSFYRIHDDVFVYHTCLAISDDPFDSEAAYSLLGSLAEEVGPAWGVPSGIRGLNDQEEVEALVQMISDGREIHLSELGTHATERRAKKVAGVSLEPATFPRENIVRLLVTVIAANAACTRAAKMMRLFGALAPHITEPISKELMAEGIDYIGRFVHQVKTLNHDAMVGLLPGDASQPPDWTTARRKYVALVESFVTHGGLLGIHAIKRLLDIVTILLQTEPTVVGPMASRILGALARTHLESETPIEFLRNTAPDFSKFISTVDFSGVLDATSDYIRRKGYELPLEISQLIVQQYVDPAIKMLAMAAEDSMGFLLPMRTAAVRLLAESVWLRGVDAIGSLEAVHYSPGLLAGIILPLCLLLEQPLDLDRGELHTHLWVRILRCVLHPNKPRRSSRIPRSLDAPPALAAAAVLELQIVKAIAVRAPHCVSKVRGLWTYISSNVLEAVTDGNGRFFGPDAPRNGLPRVVDWMTWSLFELIGRHPMPLHIDLRQRIQAALQAIQHGISSRPSSAGEGKSPVVASPIRSMSGLVRRPTMRMSVGPGSPVTSLPSSPKQSGLAPIAPLDPKAAAHNRNVSTSSQFLNVSNISGDDPPSPTSHRRLPSVGHKRQLSGSPKVEARPSFATLSTRRASMRPVFNAFDNGPQHFRFPSVSSPSRQVQGEKSGAIVHLLGPATQIISAPGAGLSLQGGGKRIAQGREMSLSRQATADLFIRNPELVAGARRAVQTTMLVYGYDCDGAEDDYRTWSVQDALHSIAEQTRLLVESEFREVFNPRQDELHVPGLPALEIQIPDPVDPLTPKEKTDQGEEPNLASFGVDDDKGLATGSTAYEPSNHETFVSVSVDGSYEDNDGFSMLGFSLPNLGPGMQRKSETPLEQEAETAKLTVPILSFSHV